MKILLAASLTSSLVNFRGGLIRELVSQGHEVVGCGPEIDENGAVAALGARFVRVPMERRGSNPLSDVSLMRAYSRLMKAERPDVVLSYTIKPNVYVPRAARSAGAKRVVAMVEGLGEAFLPQKGLRAVVALAGRTLYRLSMRHCDRVIFLNEDDETLFTTQKIIRPEQAARVNGTGLDTEYYAPTPLPAAPVFLMISRFLRAKGVPEYLDAARELKRRRPDARCLLLGGPEDGRDGMSLADVEPYVRDGSVELIAPVADVRPIIARASVVVLPSHREGLPRTPMEAMSCARAVIVSDCAGCRDVVLPGETGLMVPTGDIPALADAMEKLAADPELAAAMGRAGRAVCVERYATEKVNREMLRVLGI